MKKPEINVAKGQIWREDDNRFAERLILITHVYKDVATIITCDKNGWPLPRKRHSNAKLSRFGKARGYKLFKEAP